MFFKKIHPRIREIGNNLRIDDLMSLSQSSDEEAKEMGIIITQQPSYGNCTRSVRRRAYVPSPIYMTHIGNETTAQQRKVKINNEDRIKFDHLVHLDGHSMGVESLWLYLSGKEVSLTWPERRYLKKKIRKILEQEEANNCSSNRDLLTNPNNKESE